MTSRDPLIGRPGRDLSVRRAWLRGFAITVVLAFTLAACTRLGSPGPQPYSTAYAGDVLTAAYVYIADRYIEPLSLRRFTIDGLRGLQEIEPTLTVTDNGGSFDIVVGSTLVLRQPTPADGDSSGWAALSVAAIEAARSRSSALGEADSELLFKSVFVAALTGLDDFSRYAGAEEAKDFRAVREGFGGIGISVRMASDDAFVVRIEDDSPAQAGGLAANDRITRIDGVPIAGWTQSELIRTLRGLIGMPVHLLIVRDEPPLEFGTTLTRARIVPTTVSVERRGPVAVVAVSSFNQQTGSSLAETISGLRKEAGRDVTGIILDLRGNPGGLLDQAVEVADVFLADGEIVLTRGRHPHAMQRFTATGADMSGGLPLIVLVNGNSASASEVVAAALQDLGRAVVIGTNSHGKGTVQTVYRLPNDGELTLTWSRLHAPSGYLLHGRGVLPTVCTRDYQQVAPAGLVDALRAGEAAAQETLPRWRKANSTDRDLLRSLRQICPSDTRVTQTDIEIAAALIGDPSLYAEAVSTGDTAVATTDRQ